MLPGIYGEQQHLAFGTLSTHARTSFPGSSCDVDPQATRGTAEGTTTVPDHLAITFPRQPTHNPHVGISDFAPKTKLSLSPSTISHIAPYAPMASTASIPALPQSFAPHRPHNVSSSSPGARSSSPSFRISPNDSKSFQPAGSGLLDEY
ncbi:hypothetical protein P691DRAFT_762908 [Macrolepiota fuliginosa MF-IS2]|uniref:Uncharacterized protein n=1 Tax=Macrolepiota fuliginosa MF-IS2 TaxID=1400762 RepID=A0A9P6BZ48_9AGAR|nr:hypothetical protein P691DRAFT_762908 [Macrolepiota fuliginosa MF-IS2]